MQGQAPDGAGRAAERAVRASYGKLLAYLSRSWRDVSAAEDALSEALTRALESWPKSGVPHNPEAWLLVVARNRLMDAARTSKVRREALESLLVLSQDGSELPTIADRRLELLFVCANPAIDVSIRTALMLQTVLGISAERIASSFLVSPDAMGRRLSRAKARIRDAGVSFALPEPEDLPERLDSVLEAVYSAYGQGWDGIASSDAARSGLAEEALWLSRILLETMPDNAEAHGLLALILFCQARAEARRAGGNYVPFADQDIELWDLDAIVQAEALLHAAGKLGSPGRYQLEGAIQSAMVQSRLNGLDMRGPLVSLHAALVSYAPTVGNLVGWVAALAERDGVVAGLEALALVPQTRVASYQPYWALKSHLLILAKADLTLTTSALDRAVGLCEDEATRRYLLGKKAALKH